MQENFKVSVLIATFNGEKFLEEQLQSIARQTLKPFEIVISDDNSSDGTVSVIENFNKQCNIPIKLLLNKKNKGFAKNFLEAFEHCSGEYVAFCDQDDVWMSQKLSKLKNTLEANAFPSMAFSDCVLVDQNLKSLNQTGLNYLVRPE